VSDSSFRLQAYEMRENWAVTHAQSSFEEFWKGMGLVSLLILSAQKARRKLHISNEIHQELEWQRQQNLFRFFSMAELEKIKEGQFPKVFLEREELIARRHTLLGGHEGESRASEGVYENLLAIGESTFLETVHKKSAQALPLLFFVVAAALATYLVAPFIVTLFP
jgi:hypothetical protein